MAHLSPARVVWNPLDSIGHADWATIDGNTFVALNGATGGTWTPSSPIVIGGAGAWCGGPWTLKSGSAAGHITTSPGAGITFGDSDFFQLPVGHVGGSRVIAHSCFHIRGVGFSPIQSGSCLQSMIPGANGVIPLRAVNGSQLFSAALTYRIGSSHIPAVNLQARIVYIDSAGNVSPIIASGSDSNGWISAPGTTSSSYYKSGQTQTITIVPTYAINVDTTRFRYYAEIVDESGASSVAGNQFQDVMCTFTSIRDTRFQ